MTSVTDITEMDRAGLLDLWRCFFEDMPPKKLSTPFLRRILAFESQAHEQGGLSKDFKRKLKKAAYEAASNGKGRQLHPGGRLIREWNGKSHVVDVTESGFLWQEKPYRSLSAGARAITGARWSGPRFFGLTSTDTP